MTTAELRRLHLTDQLAGLDETRRPLAERAADLMEAIDELLRNGLPAPRTTRKRDAVLVLLADLDRLRERVLAELAVMAAKGE